MAPTEILAEQHYRSSVATASSRSACRSRPAHRPRGAAQAQREAAGDALAGGRDRTSSSAPTR